MEKKDVEEVLKLILAAKKLAGQEVETVTYIPNDGTDNAEILVDNRSDEKKKLDNN
jgi:hypothetical protein